MMGKDNAEALKRERNRLLAILEGTDVGTWEWNIQTGETIFNEKWANMIGYTLKELSPITVDTWKRFTHPEDQKEAERKLENHFRGETAFYRHEIRLKHKSGRWIWLLSRGKVATWTEDGKPEWMYGSNQDITEQKTPELQLAALAENINEGIILTASDGRIEGVNRCFFEMFGYTPETEMVGEDGLVVVERVAQLFKDPALFIKRVMEMTEAKTPVFNEQWSLKDGRYIERDFFPISRFSTNDSYYWVHRDVTKQKKLELKLTQNEQNFRNFFDTNMDLLWVLNEDGIIKKLNRTALDRLGYKQNEIKGTHLAELFQKKHREEVRQYIKKNQHGEKSSCRIPIITKAGVQIPVETYLFPGEWNGRNAFFGISRDLTELVLSEEKFSKAFKSSPVAISLSDMTTKEYIDVNSSFCNMVGLQAEDIIGKRFSNILKGDESARDNFIEQVKELGFLRNMETEIERLDGTKKNVLLSVDIINIQEEEYFFTTTIDVTELKKTIEEKNLLMRELNHRVKNNMIMISSLISMKSMETNTDLSDIENQIEAIRIVHETLYKTENYTTVNLKDYAQDLLENIFSTFNGCPIRIINGISDIWVETETALPIGLIINEVATNSVKYGFNGSEDPVFTIEMKQTADRKGYILQLSNNGPAFPEDKDMNNPTTLGLRIISTLVIQLRGTIELEKMPHPVFTIRFSLKA